MDLLYLLTLWEDHMNISHIISFWEESGDLVALCQMAWISSKYATQISYGLFSFVPGYPISVFYD